MKSNRTIKKYVLKPFSEAHWQNSKVCDTTCLCTVRTRMCNFTYKPCKLHFGLRMKFFIYFVKFILYQLHIPHELNIYLRLSLTIY